MSGLSVDHPALSRIDEPWTMVVSGVGADERVDITLEVEDGARRRWSSSASFSARADGTVDLTRQAPLAGGSYEGVDPMGLLWSMLPVEGSAFFTRTRPLPLVYTCRVRTAAGEVSETTFERCFRHRAVEHPVEDGVVVGTLHLPEGEQSSPGVLLLGGSDGQPLDAAAALLADHGFAVLAARWFGAEGRPAQLTHVELDELDAHVDWLLRHPSVCGDSIRVVGFSRGAELALELASGNADVSTVVAGAPSSVRQAGITSDHRFTEPAWQRHGEALPFLRGASQFTFMWAWLGSLLRRRGLRQDALFSRMLRRTDQVERATIPVEQCRGPIIVITGDDDGLWPSTTYAQRIAARLASKGRSDTFQHRQMLGAGHFCSYPYALVSLPPMTELRANAAFRLDFGGSARDNARAARDSWRVVLAALEGPPHHDEQEEEE